MLINFGKEFKITITFFAAQIKQFTTCWFLQQFSHSPTQLLLVLSHEPTAWENSLLVHNNKVCKFASEPTLIPPCCTVIPLCSCSLVIPIKTLQTRKIYLLSIQKLEAFSFSSKWSQVLAITRCKCILGQSKFGGCWKFEGGNKKIDEHWVKWKLQRAMFPLWVKSLATENVPDRFNELTLADIQIWLDTLSHNWRSNVLRPAGYKVSILRDHGHNSHTPCILKWRSI